MRFPGSPGSAKGTEVSDKSEPEPLRTVGDVNMESACVEDNTPTKILGRTNWVHSCQAKYRNIQRLDPTSSGVPRSTNSGYCPGTNPEIPLKWLIDSETQNVVIEQRTVYPGQTWPTYSDPSGFFMKTPLRNETRIRKQMSTHFSTPRV